jgi:hypothetical protein
LQEFFLIQIFIKLLYFMYNTGTVVSVRETRKARQPDFIIICGIPQISIAIIIRQQLWYCN